MKDRISAYDVAEKAGVSQSTVSRVLNNYPFMKETTRQKVLTAIEELGFTRDEIARSLASKKTRTIGLILGDITNPFFSESAKVITRKAQEMDYNVILCNTNHSEENLNKYIQTLMGKRVDGIIIASADKDNQKIKELYDKGFPIILYNSIMEHDHANYIAVNNYKGAQLAVEHLYHFNHREISYIAGPSKYVTTHLRNLGFKDALDKFGLKMNDKFIYDREFSYDEVYLFAKNLLNQQSRPTSFFASSDQMALAVLDAAASEGISVPDQLSVIGFDDIDLAKNQFIGLTTITQPKEKMAMLTLEKLVSLIEEKEHVDAPIQIVLEPELISRKTTGVYKP
ncbi:substrate-binding domain-containing protein [Halobacillus litoralis]|uniref:Substrate-binding domain-containing protein n=1 Tax=Halobacillus litoralis TaxID=45668 RepID=A0A845FBF6_9BACI|nr:LacI family DNA-binding transcriptional regulator [Halobacillus litoralis]MYL71752.1 substrate-binding domain-containing protein [Halobacillus litoralis]